MSSAGVCSPASWQLDIRCGSSQIGSWSQVLTPVIESKICVHQRDTSLTRREFRFQQRHGAVQEAETKWIVTMAQEAEAVKYGEHVRPALENCRDAWIPSTMIAFELLLVCPAVIKGQGISQQQILLHALT